MKKSNIIMLLAAILPLGLFLFPLWKITLEAPQYPTPLGMYIHINDFSDANPHDIKNINLMNHYVGMKYIPEAIPEFKIFPAGILITTVIGLIIALKGNYKWFLYWFILMIVLSAAGLYDFYLWEYDYGHNLSDTAPIKVPGQSYQPPFIGGKWLLNFYAESWPSWGALFFALPMALSGLAFWKKKKA